MMSSSFAKNFVCLNVNSPPTASKQIPIQAEETLRLVTLGLGYSFRGRIGGDLTAHTRSTQRNIYHASVLLAYYIRSKHVRD